MNESFVNTVLTFTKGTAIEKIESIQSLWSGYGDISRYQVLNGVADTVVIKHVKLPDQTSDQKTNHPRGWNTSLSHKRKIKSYDVECVWYNKYSQRCNDACRVPSCFGVKQLEGEFLMVLEDLDTQGFAVRKTSATFEDMKLCLKWLANFHCQFLFYNNVSSDSTNTLTAQTLTGQYKDLWETGCYWHLETRPDELEALSDIPLKNAASKIDRLLKQTSYQTLVHGDAKLANFCFSETGNDVAAVDFQYVGMGCGMKDVAYFIGSCLDSEGCEKHADDLLDYYFESLSQAMLSQRHDVNFDDLETQWRPLFDVAWADFHRFLKGWSPDHWKIHPYSERITQKVLNSL